MDAKAEGGRRGAGGAAAAAKVETAARIKGLRDFERVAALAQMRREAQVLRGVAREARARGAMMSREARARGAMMRREARHATTVRGRRARALAGRVTGAAGGAVRAVGAAAASILALGGGFAAAGAIRAEKAAGAKAAALANQAFHTTGETRSRDQLKAAALGTARPLGVSTGFGTEKVLDAMRQFMSISGSFRGGTELASFMTDLADASDADLGDVGKTAGQVFQSVNQALTGIGDPAARYAEALKQTKAIMAVVAGQAKEGSIEMRDMASNMGKLMSAAGMFSGDISDLANTMGGIGQMAIAGGAASPEEAMTALANFAQDLIKKGSQSRGAFKEAGVDVFTDKSHTKLRDPGTLMAEAVSKTKGNLTQLTKMFGMRGLKAVLPLHKMYVEAGGGGAGMAAMQKALAEKRGQKMSATEITESAGFRRAQDDKQFDMAMANFQNAIGQELLPALTKLVPEFVKLIPVLTKGAEALGKFVSDAAENPLAAAGKIILALMIADLAKAAIGAAVSSALTKIIMTASAGGAGAGGAGAGGAGMAGLAKAGGMIAGVAGGAWIGSDVGSNQGARTGGSVTGGLAGAGVGLGLAAINPLLGAVVGGSAIIGELMKDRHKKNGPVGFANNDGTKAPLSPTSAALPGPAQDSAGTRSALEATAKASADSSAASKALYAAAQGLPVAVASAVAGAVGGGGGGNRGDGPTNPRP